MSDPRQPDADELAAVVADGRPFDWSAVEASGRQRPLRALWQAVRRTEGDRTALPPARAVLSAPLVWITMAALAKAAVTAGVLGFALQSVNMTQVVTLASFTLVGAVLVYGGRRDVRARRLGVLLVLLGSVMTKPLLRQVFEAWAGPAWLITATKGVVAEAMLPFALWSFVEVFPQSAWSPRDARWMGWGLAGSMSIGVLLLVANVAIASGANVPGLWTLDRDTTVVNGFWPIVVFVMVPALRIMLRRRHDAEPDERAKVTAFVASIITAFLPATAIITVYYVQTIRLWMQFHDALTEAAMYSGLVVLPLATTYAVLAHGLLRVELVLRSAARYALARGSLMVLGVGPLMLFALYVYQHRDRPVGMLFADPLGRTLLGVSAAGATLLTMRVHIQRLIDRALRRDGVSLASALDLFARRSGEGLGLGDVAEAVRHSVVAAFHPATVALLIADRARDAFVPVGASVSPLSRTTWLAQSLTGVRDPVVVDLEDAHGVARLLPHADQAWLADSGVVVLAPLGASGGTLCGLLAVGPMAGGRDYTDADLRYLGALAAAAAPAIESRLLRSVNAAGRQLDDVRWEDESGRECPACGRTFAADVNACRACGVATAPMGIPVHLHGKFTVTRRLGAGGMGVAYLADDDALGRAVVLKTLPRVRPEAVEQLRREARAMAQVSHPAVATIHGLESWRAVPVLVVEYLPGGTLADRLRRGPLPEVEVVAVARHVLSGLRRLHEVGLLHRDLKPSNIGFAADGTAKLLDFGLSRLRAGAVAATDMSGSSADGVSTQSKAEPTSTALAGTPAYMSPELVAGRAPSPADDVWALAVVMLEALQGGHPWANQSMREVLQRLRTAEAPGWTTEGLECSLKLRRLLAATLSREPGERLTTASAFESKLDQAYQ